MSDTASDPFTTAITSAIDDLRRAVFQARQGAPVPSTVEEFADAIASVADDLREATWRSRPLETRVAGSYYALGDPPRLRLRHDDWLILPRYLANRHDANTIGLHAADGTRVGYLPRGHAADLAPHLDGGLAATATIARAGHGHRRGGERPRPLGIPGRLAAPCLAAARTERLNTFDRNSATSNDGHLSQPCRVTMAGKGPCGRRQPSRLRKCFTGSAPGRPGFGGVNVCRGA